MSEIRVSHGITRVHIATLFDDSPDDADLQVIELDPARVPEAESERYELYRQIWCKEFRDIREDSAPLAMQHVTETAAQTNAVQSP